MMNKSLLMVLGISVAFAGVGAGAGTFLSSAAATAEAEAVAAEGDAEHAEAEEGKDAEKEEVKEPIVVEIGRVMVPVYKPRSISYVVANVAISVTDDKKAELYKTEAGATKVRNHIITAMVELSETPILAGAELDSGKISDLVKTAIHPDFQEIDEVLFVSLLKTDMAR
jgi:flagellar basal body-associated protein FliL